MLRPCRSSPSTIPLPGPAGRSGIPEVLNGPRTPTSPPSAPNQNTPGRGAAHHIRSECERFCCEILKATFLGEGKVASRDSLVMDAHTYGQLERSYSLGSVDSQVDPNTKTTSFLEVWDYEGGSSFRGFTAERYGKRALFVFFDAGTMGQALKPGLMALIELCDSEGIQCEQLVICVDRQLKVEDRQVWVKNLRWVGFEAATLADWTDGGDITSDKWLLFSMEI